jgi:lysophospholipase L1-like esterase/ribosomal protein L25 (general stress protein Ctc)
MKKLFFLLSAVIALQLSAEILKQESYTKNMSNWRKPNYWGGTLEHVQDGKTKVIKLDATEKNGRIFGKIYGRLKRQIPYHVDDNIQITILAKGTGNITSGVLGYKLKDNTCKTHIAKVQVLTDTYKQYKFNVSLNDIFNSIAPFIEVQGKNSKVFIKSFKMETIIPTNGYIKAAMPFQVLPEKTKKVSVQFNTSYPNKEIFVTLYKLSKITVAKVKTDAKGNVKASIDTPQPGLYSIIVSLKGQYATAYIEITNTKAYQTSKALADKVKLNKPIKALILGDSLSDYYRGYNYVDRLNFWLNKSNPGKFTFNNRGVRGDFCLRLLDRMKFELKQTKKAQFNQFMFKDLFKGQYDLIFFFLGQNDSRAFKNTQYKVATTTPDAQLIYLDNICKILKEKFPSAKIVFLAPSPSYYDHFYKAAMKTPPNRNAVIYGIKELVDAYDATNKKFCSKNNIPYIDILSVMRKQPSLKNLYVADGVHLSPLGGQVIADEMLKFFAK